MNTTPVLRALALAHSVVSDRRRYRAMDDDVRALRVEQIETLSEMIRIGNLDDADTKLALLDAFQHVKLFVVRHGSHHARKALEFFRSLEEKPYIDIDIVCGDGTNNELSISPDDYAALMKLAGESSHRSLAHYLTDVLTDALDRNLGRAGD